jgi:hypothetical protein
MLNAFAKLETIMKSKVLLQSAIAKTVEQVVKRRDVSTSFRRESRLTDTYEISAKTSYERKTKLLFLLMERMALYEWPLGCH